MVLKVERLSVTNRELDRRMQVHVQIAILSVEHIALNEVGRIEALLG
jgi:hypothetical protein